jgi:2-amino-4-hydroxy-6-hydroxymethyldihydropteridine diphosphokinase
MLCYLGLGANLGERAHQLAQAISALASHPQVLLLRVSSVYETAPLGYPSQPDFLNMAILLEADCDPLTLLRYCQQVEERLGRVRSFPNAPRTMDIDLLACGDIMLQSEELTLPHPRLLERQFVVVPLAEIAPELRIAGRGPLGGLAEPERPEIKLVGRLREAVQGGL